MNGGSPLDKLHELQTTAHHKSLTLMVVNRYDWGDLPKEQRNIEGDGLV
jgi:hypothetical protein